MTFGMWYSVKGKRKWEGLIPFIVARNTILVIPFTHFITKNLLFWFSHPLCISIPFLCPPTHHNLPGNHHCRPTTTKPPPIYVNPPLPLPETTSQPPKITSYPPGNHFLTAQNHFSVTWNHPNPPERNPTIPKTQHVYSKTTTPRISTHHLPACQKNSKIT